jgi:hypothetical protein
VIGTMDFFFTLAELYSKPKEYYNEKMPKLLIGKNFVGILQPWCRRKCCGVKYPFYSYFVMFCSQGLGFSWFLQTRVFPTL